MEGLRGFAVFLVFLVHYVTLAESWLSDSPALRTFADALRAAGHTGVDLFFVLSGFLIYGSLIARPQAFRRFMSRRVQRIYPAFLAVFFLYLMLSYLFPQESKLPSSAYAAAVYLAQNLLLLPGLFPIEPMITVAWSLSYEMFFYLLIPLAIGVLALRRWTPWQRVSLFLAIGVCFLAYSAWRGGHVRLSMFLAGMLLYEVMTARPDARPGPTAGALALAAGLAATLVPTEGAAGYTARVALLSASFFVLCLSCFAEPRAWLGRAFSWTPLRWLGNMSYSYYLIHGLTLKACFLGLAVISPVAPGGWLFFLAWMVATFLVTLLPAAGLYLLIERPFSLARYIAPERKAHTTLPQVLRAGNPVGRDAL